MIRPFTVQVLLAVAMFGVIPAHAGPALAPLPEGWGAVFSEDTPEETLTLAVGDFNGDGIADVVKTTPPKVKGAGPYSLTVLLGRADGTFARGPSRNLVGSNPRALVVGDFNGDGKLDVIVGDADGTLLELLGDGKGNLAPPSRIATLGSVVSIAVGHFTHSGKLDLAISDLNSNSAAILLGAGDGTFKETWAFALPQQGKEFHLATADFNQDGVADLAITSEEDGNYEVMLGNGNGTFTYDPKLSHLKDPNSYCPT